MKVLPQFTKSQIELLRVALLHFNFQLHDTPTLFKTLVEIDYYFDGMFAYSNPIDKRKLAYEGESYIEQLTQPLDDLLKNMHMQAEVLP